MTAAEPAGSGIALVTVTHDSEGELRALLWSVSRHLPGARVVVVDSGSRDGSLAVAEEWEGRAATLDMGANVGFGRAVNAGLREVGEPVTVVVNPDVELIDGSLAELAREAARPDRPERLLAPLVLLPDGSRQDIAQREPGSPLLALSALVPSVALPPPLRRAVDPWRSDRPVRVGWAVGCCIAARTETLRRLGPFDERIFLYGEDLDLCLKAADQGVETWFWPAARIRHEGAHSTNREFGGEAYELLARQRREVVARRRGRARAALDDWLMMVTLWDRIALKTLLRRPTRAERERLAALRRVRRSR
jgi:N-acetylglucosaminyl-diphospho-decaprenol L-rhamnosyltransferase